MTNKNFSGNNTIYTLNKNQSYNFFLKNHTIKIYQLPFSLLLGTNPPNSPKDCDSEISIRRWLTANFNGNNLLDHDLRCHVCFLCFFFLVVVLFKPTRLQTSPQIDIAYTFCITQSEIIIHDRDLKIQNQITWRKNVEKVSIA